VDANALIHRFADRGIRLWFDGGKIVVEPASRLTQSDREAIRRWKPALLDVLKGDVEGNLDPSAHRRSRRILKAVALPGPHGAEPVRAHCS
jgi:hypothetical protein